MTLRKYFTRTYLKSLIGGFINQRRFRNVHTYCMFIGYPRSGHSLIGALIDAHPNAIIGMETDVLLLTEFGLTRNQIFYMIYKKSLKFTNVYQNCWTGYSYKIPDSFQGRYTDLLVIGDKQGGKSSIRIGNNPTLLPYFLSLIKYPIKILHIVRNPFDIITTMYTRDPRIGNDFNRELFEFKIDKFFAKADVNQELLKNKNLTILTIFHENFIAAPKKELFRILTHIGLDTNENFLDQCASIIYDQPHHSRFKIIWPDELKIKVEKKLTNYSFLKHYEFEEPNHR
jgi:hypothetical protein